MIGSTHFSLKSSANFERSFRKLAKVYGKNSLPYLRNQNFTTYFGEILENLLENPYPEEASLEPLPGVELPKGWTFYKLRLKIGKGASGQIRLMYLVNPVEQVIFPVWIYSHEQFAKRPSNEDLRQVFQDIWTGNE